MRGLGRLCALVMLAGLAGCSRAHYRLSADRETYPIIAERVTQPAYDVGPVDIEPAPLSRLADEFDPDFPPKPPDDPAAAEWMDHPGYFRGARNWERDGVADRIEPEGWELALEPDERGVVRLDQAKAVEIALLDSRQYQTAEEELYLAALRLTLSRFQFDLQWFLSNDTTYTHAGAGSSAGGETNTLSSPTNFGFSRNLAAGGQLLVDFANSLVYQYTGSGSRRFGSNLLVSLSQPLLRNAGRDIALEELTQSERNVLYAVRDFARFRKQFWADVAISRGGYLDLLLQIQTIRNARANLQQQEETYKLYRELFQGGRASAVEFDQFFTSLQAARLAVIQAETALQDALDAFKVRLGLPPHLPVELDATPLEEFVPTDEKLEAFRAEVEAFQRQRLAELDAPPEAEALREHFATLAQLTRRVPPALAAAHERLGAWSKKLEQPDPAATPEQREQAQRAYELLQKQLPDMQREIEALGGDIERHRREVRDDNRQESWEAIVDDVQRLLALADGVITAHAQTGIYLIELAPLQISEEDAIGYALANRLDLQNAQAQLTDAWRKVRIAANALRSDLDVVASANLGTDADHLDPFNFAAEASVYTLGLRFDGPLNRQSERNAYRASLIAYQRARRNFMALSDQIELQVRRDLRQLRLTRDSFEISRQQLLSAARQLEGVRITLLGPRQRGQNDATTLNLLQALRALLDARNQLVANYINYQQQRVQLLLDLEALQLDPQGMPIYDPLRVANPLLPVGQPEQLPPVPGTGPEQPGLLPQP